MNENPSNAVLVVVNYGSSELLERNLGEQGLERVAKVHVVDNFTSSEEALRVASMCERHGWTATLLDHNFGFGSAVNKGVDLSRKDDPSVVVLLNPDARIETGQLSQLVSRVMHSPDSIRSPLVLKDDGSDWMRNTELLPIRGLARHRYDGADIDPPWLSGACLAVSMTVWDRLGGFRDEYFLYWEDVDLTFRHRRAGGTLRVDDDLVAFHDAGGTQRSEGAKSHTYAFYNSRNRIVFARTHLPRWQRFAWMASTPLFLVSLTRMSEAPSVAWLVRFLWAATRGFFDGVFLRVRRAV